MNRIRIYLKADAPIVAETVGSPLLRILGIQVVGQHTANPYVTIDDNVDTRDPEKTLPERIIPFIKNVSIHEVLCPAGNWRARGLYRHRSAAAVVNHTSKDGELYLTIQSDNVADAVILRHLIRIGDICPVDPYENKQIEIDSVRSLLQLLIRVIFRKLDHLMK